MKKIIYSYLFFALFFNSQYSLADTISRIEAETLMAECKHFRDKKIALLREIEIDKCANEKGKELDYCIRFHKDYGESYRDANGMLKIGMFWDSPVCEKALDVEKYFKVYPSKEKYQYKK